GGRVLGGVEPVGGGAGGGGGAGCGALPANPGVHGLVSFFPFDPSRVRRLNGSPRRGVTYLSGNIVEAEKGFRVNPACFLYLPLRLVISEAPDGTAVLGVDVPADLLGAFSGPEMADVGAVFTRTLATLLRHLRLPVPAEI